MFVTLPIFPFCMGLSGRNVLNFVQCMLIYASATQRKFLVFLWVVSPSIVFRPSSISWQSRVVMHSCSLMPFLLWSVKPFYFRMTRRNKLQHLIHFQDWVKVVVFRRSRMLIQLLFYSTLEYYPLSCQECYGNCTTSYEFLIQWYLSPSLFIPWSPCCCTNELWCVNSIPLLVVSTLSSTLIE